RGHGAGDVGGVAGVLAADVHDDDVVGLDGGGVFRVVQHGGIQAGPNDGRVGGALASALHEFVLHEAGDFALGDTGPGGAHGGAVRGHGGIRGFADALNFAGVLDHAQAGEQRAGIACAGGGHGVGAVEPGHGSFRVATLVHVDDGPRGAAGGAEGQRRGLGHEPAELVGELIEREDAVEAGALGGVGCVGSELGAGPALFGAVACGQEEDLGGRVAAFAGSGGRDQHGTAGIGESGQVEIVFVLAVGREPTGLFHLGEDEHAVFRLAGEGFAPGTIVGVGLAIKR